MASMIEDPMAKPTTCVACEWLKGGGHVITGLGELGNQGLGRFDPKPRLQFVQHIFVSLMDTHIYHIKRISKIAQRRASGQHGR